MVAHGAGDGVIRARAVLHVLLKTGAVYNTPLSFDVGCVFRNVI